MKVQVIGLHLSKVRELSHQNVVSLSMKNGPTFAVFLRLSHFCKLIKFENFYRAHLAISFLASSVTTKLEHRAHKIESSRLFLPSNDGLFFFWNISCIILQTFTRKLNPELPVFPFNPSEHELETFRSKFLRSAITLPVHPNKKSRSFPPK